MERSFNNWFLKEGVDPRNWLDALMKMSKKKRKEWRQYQRGRKYQSKAVAQDVYWHLHLDCEVPENWSIADL